MPVHFTYVAPKTAAGKDNNTYTALMSIIDGTAKSYMSFGTDASVITIDSSIDLNEFYSDRSGKEELVSTKRNEGGFVHIGGDLNPDETKRDTFEEDMVITNVRIIDADSERNLPEKAILRGVIFNSRKAILPVEFDVLDPIAINYFSSLDASASNPVFTRVKGRQVSEVVTREIREESAFGEDSVRTVKNTRKGWVVTWAARDTYDWDSEDTILASELKTAMADREVYLASIKKRQDDYKASKNSAFVPTGATFNF